LDAAAPLWPSLSSCDLNLRPALFMCHTRSGRLTTSDPSKACRNYRIQAHSTACVADCRNSMALAFSMQVESALQSRFLQDTNRPVSGQRRFPCSRGRKQICRFHASHPRFSASVYVVDADRDATIVVFPLGGTNAWQTGNSASRVMMVLAVFGPRKDRQDARILSAYSRSGRWWLLVSSRAAPPTKSEVASWSSGSGQL